LGNPLLMISSLCEAYHWTYEEAMRRTLPQIIMLNHAAWVNHERMELELEAESGESGGTGRYKKRKKNEDPDGVTNMTSEQFMMYWGSANAKTISES
jgi:hypothetical protein